MTEEQFTTKLTWVDPGFQLTLGGIVDQSTTRQLRATFDSLPPSAVILVDLAAVTLLDSSGLSLLLSAHARAAQEGGRFVLARPSAAVRRVLAIKGLDQLLTIVDVPPNASDRTMSAL